MSVCTNCFKKGLFFILKASQLNVSFHYIGMWFLVCSIPPLTMNVVNKHVETHTLVN